MCMCVVATSVLEERPRDVQEWTETFFLDYELKQKVERLSS